VQVATFEGKESACVVVEYDKSTIKVGCVDGTTVTRASLSARVYQPFGIYSNEAEF
jgi:hypothetical protein